MSRRPLFFSLRAKLLVTYVGLIIVGLGVLTLIAGQQLAQSAFTDFARNLQVTSLLLATTLIEPLEDGASGRVNEQRLGTLVSPVTGDSRTRVTIYDTAGNVLYDSAGQVSSVTAASAPEMAASAVEPVLYDVRPNEAGEATVYTAAPVVYENRTVGVVQLSAPASIPQTAVNQRWLALAAAFAVMVGLALLVSLWLSSTLTRPLTQLRLTALKLAAGDLSQRIKDPREDEIGEVAVAFNQMAVQVSSMVEEQRSFASNASHELRTPLTTIRLRTEALQTGSLDEATAQQYVREIDGETKRLGSLVDDLMLLSRVDADYLKISDERVDPCRLAAALYRQMEPLAQQHAITLTLECEPRLPVVQANLNHLRVVWRNMLENGIKYNEAGGTVNWLLTREGNLLRISVADDGRGIAADDLPHIEERFYRADKAHSRSVQGVGLGLALVDSIVAAYAGRFLIESPGEGQGTTATVWWPFRQSGTDVDSGVSPL